MYLALIQNDDSDAGAVVLKLDDSGESHRLSGRGEYNPESSSEITRIDCCCPHPAVTVGSDTEIGNNLVNFNPGVRNQSQNQMPGALSGFPAAQYCKFSAQSSGSNVLSDSTDTIVLAAG